ncbi:hypothetical protein MKZ38_009387 [Zalerion maritima]|uniref:Ubiquitination network signaling protein n=1 Tax=Zalerion maritima TaxID=339359 RepID=A0AAD5RG94_9PEZI|nr:hypothetical protein MKZ38_009387 [Zalerion maritima]
MLGLSVDPVQSPVLGTQSLGQQARQQILRMPRAAPSHAKRHHGARSSDLSSVSSAASSSPSSGTFSGKDASSFPSTLPAHSHRRNHNSRIQKSNGQAGPANISNANGFSCPHGNRSAPVSPNGHAASNENASSIQNCATAANGFDHSKNPVNHVVSSVPDHRRDSLGSSSVASSSVAESFTSQSSIHIPDKTHRRIDITTMNNEIHRDPGHPGPISLILTVVSMCPAYDTIAILVLLMQLSGFFLSLVYMLFTFLTFVPPATSIGFNSLSVATVKEVLQESTFSLSYLTVFLIDSIIFMLWLFLWEPAQNVVLDLSKMVIALTLGGGVSSRGGGWRGIVACLGVIAYSHAAHRTSFTLPLGRIFPEWCMTTPAHHDLPGFSTAVSFAQLSPWGKACRVVIQILAIHIFSQGVSRYIRDWLLWSQKRESQSQTVQDPEAGKLHSETSSATDNTSVPTDVDAAATAGASQPSRKKRKQSTQVRLMQPLWAAIASTKIVMTKEMELSGQKKLRKKPSELGTVVNRDFYAQEGLIWQSDVDSEEAFFATSSFPDVDPAEDPVIDTRHPDSSSLIDSTKPFYVRVNNAIWPSMQMLAVAVKEGGEEDEEGEEEEEEADAKAMRWYVRISGLAPNANFRCEFISTHTGDVIFSTSFKTRPAMTADAEMMSSPSHPPRTQRPESPVTTLKSSIKSLESKLADEKNRLKTIKKDNQAKVKSLRKELERLSTSIQSSGNNDAKYRQKIQNNAHQKQVNEEQAEQFDAELRQLREANKSTVKSKTQIESKFNHEKDKFTKSESEFKAFKNQLEQSVRSLDAEKTTLQNKRNKVATRLAKLDGDLNQQESINDEGRKEVEQRRADLEKLEAEGASIESSMQDRLRAQQARNEQLDQRIQGIVSTMAGGSHYFAQPYGIREETEPTPQGYLDQGSGTKLNPAAPHYNPNPFSAWPMTIPATQGFSPNMWSNSGPQGPRGSLGSLVGAVGSGLPPRPRGRSSSMLSNVSGLTHFSDGDMATADSSTTATATPAVTFATPATTKTMSPPPGFSQTLSSGMFRLPPGLNQVQRSNTTGSAGSAGSP